MLKARYHDLLGNVVIFNIGFPGQIRKFISQIYFLCIQIRRFWHYGVILLFEFTWLAFKSMFLSF